MPTATEHAITVGIKECARHSGRGGSSSPPLSSGVGVTPCKLPSSSGGMGGRSSEGTGVAEGHGANSQEGGTRPTALPSGHIFASAVHATGVGAGGCCTQPKRTRARPTAASRISPENRFAKVVHLFSRREEKKTVKRKRERYKNAPAASPLEGGARLPPQGNTCCPARSRPRP